MTLSPLERGLPRMTVSQLWWSCRVRWSLFHQLWLSMERNDWTLRTIKERIMEEDYGKPFISIFPSATIAQWENEYTKLSVLPLTLVHDSLVGEWMYLTVCPPSGPDFIPNHGRVLRGIFPWLITLSLLSESVAVNDSISPQLHHTTCEQRGRRPKSNHGQTMTER